MNDNIEKLREIERLIPNSGISVDAFEHLYPGECYIEPLETRRQLSHIDFSDGTRRQRDADITISQVCNSLHLTKGSCCLYLHISASRLVSCID